MDHTKWIRIIENEYEEQPTNEVFNTPVLETIEPVAYSAKVNEEIVKDFMQNPAYTKSKSKTKKKQENKLNENDKFDSLIRKIVISFLSTAGIVLISSLLIKFIFILFS